MPPTDTPAIAVSSARLLGGVVLLALVAGVALALAWWRARAAAVDAPLQRLRGFHIFGPEDEDELPLHVPVLSGRPVVPSTSAAAPRPRRAPDAVLTATAAIALHRSTSGRLEPEPEPTPTPMATAPDVARQPIPEESAVLWNQPSPTAIALATEAASPTAAAAAATARRRPPRALTRDAPATGSPDAASQHQQDPPPATDDITLEGTRQRTTTTAQRRQPRPGTGVAGLGNPHQGRDILLVEDDATIASMYAMLLGTRGYATRHARDGLEGIDMVREELPALVLLDMMMPRMDGLQFLRALRGWSRTAELPVVILSNVSDRHLVEKAMQLGAIEYLVKAQTRPQVLLGALPHWLRGNRALTTLSP